jgi:Zn-dependent peptidase ImmA (M78 family)
MSTDVFRPRYTLARIEARAVLSRVGSEPPIDISAAAGAYGVGVVEKPLGRSRGVAIHRNGRMEIALNNEWPWHGAGERRWVIAEELGHLLLGHPAIVQAVADGAGWIRQATLDAVDREARFFAQEVLMPAAAVRNLLHMFRPVTAIKSEAIVEGMAERFQVSKTAMGYRLEGMKLIKPWEERSRWEEQLASTNE